MKLHARLLAVVLIGGLGVGGCGSGHGSSHSATGSSSQAAPSSPAQSSPTGAPTGSSTVASSSAVPAFNGTASSTSAAGSAAQKPDANVRLPAKFTIRTGGALDPPVIAAPRHTDVALTVVSGDHQVHTFVLLTPHPYRMTAPPSAHVLLRGVPDGTYAVEVDHVRPGSLIIGAAPGP